MRATRASRRWPSCRAARCKGSVVAFAERLTRGSGYHTGWIWVGSGEPQRFQLRDIDGFNITDAAGLPDGGLLVLERYFRWTEGVKMRLRRIAGERDRAGRAPRRPHLLEADSSFEIDNMEGLAVHRGAGGETIVSLISDDNFNHLLQRTLFLQFTLLDEEPRSAARPMTCDAADAVATFASATSCSPATSAWSCTCTGSLYAREYGLDTTFEPYVAKPLADFVLERHGAAVDRGGWRIAWSARSRVVDAERGRRRSCAGSCCVPEARGSGLGKRLLDDGARLLPAQRGFAARVPLDASPTSTTRCGSTSARASGSPRRRRARSGAPSAPRCAWTSSLRHRRVAARSGRLARCCAFFTSRLSFWQRSDSSSSLAFIRKASSPPRCSTVFRACALMRRRTLRCSASLISVTSTQVGPEGALGLVLGMAAQLAGHGQLARQLTSPGHWNSSLSPAVAASLGGISALAAPFYTERRHVKAVRQAPCQSGPAVHRIVYPFGAMVAETHI